MDLATSNEGYLFIQQQRQRSQDAAFCLTPQAEEDEIVAGKDRIFYLRNDRIIKTNNPREDGLAGFELSDKICAHFVFDAQTGVICLFEFTKCFCSFHGFIIVSPAIRRYPCFPRFGNATPKIKFGPAITANQYPGMRMPSLWGVDQTAWTKVKDGCDRQFFRRLTSAGVRYRNWPGASPSSVRKAMRARLSFKTGQPIRSNIRRT